MKISSNKSIYWGKSYSISKGRDPLGMQKGSIATYGLLVPGLTNLTKRIRYYGYYCWLLYFFEKNILNNEKNQAEAFRLFIRRAEYLMAIIMMKIDSKINGVSGSRFARNYVISISKDINNEDFIIDISSGADKNDDTDNSYFKNTYGAFGQYYVGQMKYLGLIKTDDKYEQLYWVTKDGLKLSQAFEENLTKNIDLNIVVDLFLKVYKSGKLSIRDINQIQRNINLNNIVEDSEEHKSYLELLYGYDSPVQNNPENRQSFRKETILSYVKYLKENNNKSFPIDFYEDNYNALDSLTDTEIGWLGFVISEISNYAHVSLLWGILSELSMNDSRNLNDLITDVAKNILDELINQQPEIDSKTNMNEYFDDLDSSPVILIRECVDLVKNSKSKYNKIMTKAIQSIFALLKRHKKDLELFSKYAEKYGIKNNDDFIVSLAKINQYKNLPLEEVLRKLLNQNIISRHIYIALNKLRYRAQSTLKFRYEGNKLSFISLIEPEWSTPRLESLRQFLLDVHNLQNKENELAKRVLEYFKLSAK